ncbi:uncharacterized protein METZ01_LOCUS316608, partial [marine metagenome]
FYAAHNDRGWQGKEVAVYRPQQAVGYFSHNNLMRRRVGLEYRKTAEATNTPPITKNAK